MTPEWKVLVDKRLVELGWTRMELAAKLKVAKSAITAMLGPRQTSSSLVPKVCQLLNLPMPVHGTDSEVAALVGRLSREKPEQRDALIVLIRGLLGD